ncbi:hypothetical protein LTR09_001362 [Extremus antarcticus]|uniref:Uncharacterized protein n=1 Tax=Extremus antarcticus TaxID=702011 RepID=A0AAJ0GIN2_9PEZI|nr:hypothetical protein LTR09_001362 [Extremus antarcticus]
MSSSVPIPSRRDASTSGRAESSYSSSRSSSWSSPLRSASLASAPATPRSERAKGKAKVRDEVGDGERIAARRPSLLELFLPSYADYDAQDLEHKQDPVQDIILTDEEAAAMLPQ